MMQFSRYSYALATIALVICSSSVVFVNSQITDECFSQTEDLQSIDEIQTELQQLKQFVSEVPFESFCTDLSTEEDTDAEMVRLSCILDYSDFTHSLEEVCTANDGKYYESQFFVTCTDTGIEFTIGSRNIPGCVAQVCKEGNIERQFDSIFGEVEKGLQEEGLTCRAEYDGENQLSAAAGMGTALLSVIVFSLPAFLM